MIHLLATPVFAVLAVVTSGQQPPLCTVPDVWGFLSSMWFMYALMAAAHCQPWLRLAGRTAGALSARIAAPRGEVSQTGR